MTALAAGPVRGPSLPCVTLERLLWLSGYLGKYGAIGTHDLRRRLGISKRTLRRDVVRLRSAGFFVTFDRAALAYRFGGFREDWSDLVRR